METLEINRNRLSSHFDVYETLRDLIYLKKGPRKSGTMKERGISLFREIPRERTCAKAGIPGEFCVCGRFYEAKLPQTTYYLMALTLLEKVNSFVGFAPTVAISKSDASSLHSISGDHEVSKNSPPSPNFGVSVKNLTGSGNNRNPDKFSSKTLLPAEKLRELCAHLSLQKVESIYQITNDQLQSLKVKSYRVTIRTVPGLGLFEGLVNYGESGQAQVVGDVVRINLYRGQADCVVDPWLRQFCYCRQ